ncbi:MAG: efflux RND transporter periplasmic adaptor subunit [Actinobacteria bacterium]|nr:efflux RND transporter periplasmic adaptor subunit [Actinomycetota bacterium]MCL5674936.1 efflux RND transporter periplasmic adaptor subunit [Candidatus Omnitrophota bacterium]
MRKSLKKIISLIIIVVVLIAGTYFYKKHKKGNTSAFQTAKITKGGITETVETTGTVNPIITVNVGSRVSGTITNLYADYNSVVKKGEVIAVIDPSPYEIALNQAKATLLQSEAKLTGDEATLANDKLTKERDLSLYKQNFIAKNQLDNDTTAYNTAKANVSADKEEIDGNQYAVRNAELNISYTKIISPVNGIVISRNVDVGQTVAASFQTPTLFEIAQNLKKMEIDTNVNETNIGSIKPGQEADFTVYGYPDTTFKGTVYQVRIAPTTIQNVVTYDAVINVSNPDLKLVPGMTANVSIIVAKKNNVLRIPNSALIVRMPKQYPVHKKTGIWLIEKGKPLWAAIKTGINDDNYTQLVSENIKEGEKVIIGVSLQTGQGFNRGPRGPGMF